MDTIERNKKFKIKYTKNDGEEVRRFAIVTDDCRGLGNRQKDNRPFLHYFDLDKKDIDTQLTGKYYNDHKRNKQSVRSFGKSKIVLTKCKWCKNFRKTTCSN